MSNAKKWLIILLSLIALGLIGWNLAGLDTDTPTNSVLDNSQPNYQTDDSVTFVYNPAGDLAYKLVSDKIDNYTAEKITWFASDETILTIDASQNIEQVQHDIRQALQQWLAK